MAIKFFNTLTRSLEEFHPVQAGKVTFYSCGPTVYNYAHIGNLRANVFYDLVSRYLSYRGYEVLHVMNITDVDDKTIRDSQKAGQSLLEFTSFYTEAFLEDLKTLGIRKPSLLPRATDEIEGMIQLIQTLLDSGHAYRTDRGDVYFNISSFPDYGKLAKIDVNQLRANAAGRLNRADEYDKENVQDFALWKAYEESDGDVSWDAPFGKGRPGWHTECAVMAVKYLGAPIDIHAGGVDLCFPHHTNEIAQAECGYQKTFVRYWLHNEHLIVNGKKMSKSEGNFFTLRDLLERGIDPMAIRIELLKTHYRQHLDFRLDNMDQNTQMLRKFADFAERAGDRPEGPAWSELAGHIDEARSAFRTALDDDLNVSGALAALFDFMHTINRNIDRLNGSDGAHVRALLEEFDSVLGFVLPKGDEAALAPELQKLIDERSAARTARDFARADALRDQLLAHGIEVKDTPEGVRWRRI